MYGPDLLSNMATPSHWIIALLLPCALLVGLGAHWYAAPSNLVPCPFEDPPAAPDSFTVELTSTQGPVILQLYREWAPTGVDRMHCLVEHNHFEGLPVFRVVEGFVAQFGLTGDPETDSLWAEAGIPDEPVRASNERGTIAFARSGPNTRSAQLFINLSDNAPLDTVDFDGVVGFPPLGRVTDGMETVDAWYSGYGEAVSQDSIRTVGTSYLKREHPKLDVIERARIVE